MSASIFLHLDGKPFADQPRHKAVVLSRSDGVATVRDEYADDGVAFYRLSDGRRCEPDGEPTPWDFWRLDSTAGEGGSS